MTNEELKTQVQQMQIEIARLRSMLPPGSLVIVKREYLDPSLTIHHRVIHAESEIRIETSLSDFVLQMIAEIKPKWLPRWMISRPIRRSVPRVVALMKDSSRYAPPPKVIR